MKKQNIKYSEELIMQTIKYSITILLIIILISTTLTAATKLKNDNPVECFYSNVQKVFLQLNKDVYITGEDVLFKGYITNAASIPDTLCKVVYVELLNPGNQKITGFSVNLFKGVCNSYFTLPDTLTSGYYYIKAFTNQMRNFDHDYYFSAKILVANQADDRLEKLVTGSYINIDSAKVLFYTQNGNLITGIENKILFKISCFSEEWDKQPVEIITDSGKVVASVIPDNRGIGDFNLIPEKNISYYAQWNKKNFRLPCQVSDGFLIQAQKSADNIIYVTILSGTRELSDLLKFEAFNNGKNIFEKEFTMSNGVASFTIPAEKTKPGFTIFTLLNPAQKLLCKKELYIPENSELIKISSNKTTYLTREKVKILIDLQNNEMIKDSLNLLINVSQKSNSGYKKNHSPINTYFKLLSNLGNENSELLESDSLSEQQISKIIPLCDLPETISKSVCPFLPENRGYIISGYVYSKNNVPVPNVCVFLSVADSFASLKYCFTNSAGRFFFRLSRFYDNKNLIFQAKNDNNESLKIEIEDKYNGESAKRTAFEYIPGDLRNYLKYSQNIALTNKIFKPGSLSLLSNNFVGANTNNYHFYGVSDFTLFPSDFDELEDFKTIVRNILPGVFYNRSENIIRVIDLGTQTLWPTEALVLLNNIPFPDPAFIAKLGSKQIKKIDLKKNRITYGNIDFYGILSITTNQKNVYALNPSFANITVPNIVRDVPVILNGPEYLNNNNTNNSHPDLRQTLYWNPELKLSANGKAGFDFYTSDLKGNFTVEVEGITPDGKIIYSSSTIEVK